MYNLSTNNWENIPDISHRRRLAGAVTHEDKIFVVSGSSLPGPGFRGFLRSAEMFDSTSNTWVELPDMNVSRIGTIKILDRNRFKTSIT